MMKMAPAAKPENGLLLAAFSTKVMTGAAENDGIAAHAEKNHR